MKHGYFVVAEYTSGTDMIKPGFEIVHFSKTDAEAVAWAKKACREGLYHLRVIASQIIFDSDEDGGKPPKEYQQ